MRKIILIIFGVIASCSFIWGLILQISNVQGMAKPDGYPITSNWIIGLFFFIIPTASIFLIGIMWPERRYRKKNDLYCSLRKHTRLLSYEDRKVRL
jgi:hypothetical protein